MKIARGIGLVSCAALVGTFAGCTTYVQEPPSRTVYAPPPPVYVPAPPVYVEPPRVYVAPPPVYVPPAPVYSAPAVSVEVSGGLEIRSENDFYEPLSPYGRWEVVGAYGRCWIPARVESEWRPYCNGHWERTEAGWYWASDEPWAWATYHYGRWDLSAEFGWFWVPRTRWAPAWVSWHHGGGYVGWAPLQPSVRIVREAPVEVDVRLIPPRAFVFVEEKRFLEPVRPTTVVVNNTTIINKTVNITNIKVVNNTVINEGPRTQVIEQATGRTVQPVPIHELRRKTEAAVVAAKHAASPTTEQRLSVPIQPQPNRQPAAQSTFQPTATAPSNPAPAVQPATRPAALPGSAQLEAEQRARDLHQKAHEEALRHAKDLERIAQLQSEQHARELQKQAQAESQRAARELERKAQLESQQHALELHQKAQEEAQRHAKDLEKKAQVEAQRRAQELQKTAQEGSHKAALELERKAQLQAEQHARELHQRAQEAAQRPSGEAVRQPGLVPPAQVKPEQIINPNRRPLKPRKDQQPKVNPDQVPPEKPAVPVQPPPP